MVVHFIAYDKARVDRWGNPQKMAAGTHAPQDYYGKCGISHKTVVVRHKPQEGKRSVLAGHIVISYLHPQWLGGTFNDPK